MLNIGRILQLQNMTGAPMDQMQTPPQMPGNLLTDMPQPQGGIQNVSGGVNTQTDPSTPSPQTMADLYHPSHVASDAYRQTLNEMPNRATDDKPSVMRRIGGAIVGLGNGGEAGNEFTHRKFNNEMADYSNKVKLQGQGATEEDRSNVNARLVASDTIGKEQGQQKINAAADKEAAAETDKLELRRRQEQDSQTRALNASVNEWKAKNPNSIFKEIGGQMVAFDPKTNKSEVMTDKDGKPYDTGKMSDEAKLVLQLHNTIVGITARGEESRKTDAQRASEAEDLVKNKGEITKDINLGKILAGNKSPNTGTTTVSTTVPEHVSHLGGLYTTEGKGKTTTTVKTPNAPANQKMQKEIPGIPGSLAESTDGGKTWKRVK